MTALIPENCWNSIKPELNKLLDLNVDNSRILNRGRCPNLGHATQCFGKKVLYPPMQTARGLRSDAAMQLEGRS